MNRNAWMPLFVFVILLGVAGARLGQPEPPLSSALEGKPLPAFSLPLLEGGERLTPETLAGRPAILNVFGSWCVACVAEHPIWAEVSKRVAVYGIAWMDEPAKTKAWLAQRGNPYTAVGVDTDSRFALDMGVAGAPESYLISPDGRIVAKIPGPVTEAVWRDTLLPALEAMK